MVYYSAMKPHSKKSLLPVEQALNAILEKIQPVDLETIPLTTGYGRILAEPVVSEINVPPFVNSAMDGYAVIAADTAPATHGQPVSLRVVANIPAGASTAATLTPGTAARIMTGAPVPAGATAVVRFEDSSEYLPVPAGVPAPADNEVLIFCPVNNDDNIRPIGEDIRQGQMVMLAGHRLRPQDIGVLAAVGQAEIKVYRRPRVAILATGDELVEVGQPIEPGKIRNSNEYTHAAAVQKYGGEPIMLGIARDTIADLTAKIREGLDKHVDLFLTSAGVSVGDFDMVKNVLAAEGKMQFWQVAIKPGKPLAFGMLEHEKGAVPLIGLPGNPVASMVAFEVFARPALLKLGGQDNQQKIRLMAALVEDVKNSGRRHFMRGLVRLEADGYRVTTRGSGVQVQGSGILTSMVWANCLVVIPEKVTHLPAGSTVEVWLLD